MKAAISYRPDHISAYSLIVEDGTKLAAQIRRGDYTMPDNDLMADMYLLAEEYLTDAGYSWYEVSNYSSSAQTRSDHNLAYWRNQDWWGIGPGPIRTLTVPGGGTLNTLFLMRTVYGPGSPRQLRVRFWMPPPGRLRRLCS
ncbi:hypothetical radical SAM family enzyme [Rothia aeria]|uniref:Hypothetical radical SAM family enzyme n=1 Tax=Rothia aeria TaxID=172042 RepID=A0A2Z5R128_9MICC|nr:hypothetical radical SAM family enzyme [Rothia aeria]